MSFFSGLFYCVIALVTIYFARPLFRKLKNKFLSKVITNFSEKCKAALVQRKIQLFKEALLPLKINQSQLEILEIGAGPGSNFDYYPDGSNITCLEPNEYFETILRKNASNYESKISLKRLIIGKGEDIKEVDDACMDACVCTHVLCSVENPQLVISEILRILKPGGRFVFLEHVKADNGTWTQLFQRLLHFIFHKMVHSSMTRTTSKTIEEAGFSEIKIVSFKATELLKVPTNPLMAVLIKLVLSHTMGYAVK